MLTGEAKRKYQREYMRKVRMDKRNRSNTGLTDGSNQNEVGLTAPTIKGSNKDAGLTEKGLTGSNAPVKESGYHPHYL